MATQVANGGVLVEASDRKVVRQALEMLVASHQRAVNSAKSETVKQAHEAERQAALGVLGRFL